MAESASKDLKLSPNSDDESVKSSTPLYKKSKKKRNHDDMDRGHLGKKGRKGSITSIASQTSEGASLRRLTYFDETFILICNLPCHRRYASTTPQTTT